MKRSDNRGQQPKVLGSRNAVQYSKSSQYNEVARESTCSGLQQGESHVGRDVRAHVKCKGKQSLLWNDNHVERFVHYNRFQPLLACDIANGIESKCQKEDGTCARTESQARVFPVGLTVKDGNKVVRGKEANSSKNSRQVIDKACGNPSQSANSAVDWLLGGSQVLKVSDTRGSRQIIDNACIRNLF